MDVSTLSKETRRRLVLFDKLRGKNFKPGAFWDIVVLTAVDETQRESYELQLKNKIESKQLPLSANYIVIADPPGAKIGNGGSTFVVIAHLFKLYNEELWKKKVIIVHAGGFSQRLPNASLLGKAFTAIPVGNPMYQALELKLASYIEFPGKISGGGIFVCCADTIEVYNDENLPWSFSNEGFTALAHQSPISIGTTHGVFVLDSPHDSRDMIWLCRRFLHKPSREEMIATENCVVKTSEEDKWVLTDSAFFISVNVARLLLEFYQANQPLACEIDAYGDFLQALGTQSSPDYVTNVKNVCYETNSLLHLRRKVYDLLHEIPLYAVVLAPVSDRGPETKSAVTSIFFHLGTMPEYQENFTADEDFRKILGINSLASTKGIPHKFGGKKGGKENASIVHVNKHGALACTIKHLSHHTPCILGSVIHSNVEVGEGTIVEYSYIRESVTVGDHCIVSNCSLPAGCRIPSGTFIHTAGVKVDNKVKYATILFSIKDDLKKSVPTSQAFDTLSYFGHKLDNLFSNRPVSGMDATMSLWTTKLFPISSTMEESCKKACVALNKIMESERNGSNIYEATEKLYSMKEILAMKNVQSMLDFRIELQGNIDSVSSESSHLKDMISWANEFQH